MPGEALTHWFAVLSLLVSVLTALAVVALAFRGRSQAGSLRDFVAAALERAQQTLERAEADNRDAIAKANPAEVSRLLEEFNNKIVARVQQTERGFVALGDEVTEALDKAETLRASASAKESRARTLRKRRDREEEEEGPGNGAAVAPWDNPNLSRADRLALWELHCQQTGRM